MAAKTPDNIYLHSLGDTKLIRAVFSTTNIDDTDTWASGITGIVDYWFQGKQNPATQSDCGANIALSGSTFTFYPAAENTEGTLFIMVKN